MLVLLDSRPALPQLLATFQTSDPTRISDAFRSLEHTCHTSAVWSVHHGGPPFLHHQAGNFSRPCMHC